MKLAKRMVKLLFWGIIPLLLLAMAGRGNAQQYQYHDLGTLGGTESEAYGINANGWVVGMAQTTSGDWHAFLKKPDAAMEDLGTLGGTNSYAYGINDNNWVVGAAETATEEHAFLKKPDDQSIQDLGTLGGPYSWANCVNADGWVVGQSFTTSGVRAFLKKPDDQSMQDLGTLGGPYSWANGINTDGWVVGQSFTSTVTFHAFLKKPDDQSMQDLDALSGTCSSAWAINANGWVVGESETASGDWHAFLKKPDDQNMQDLVTLGGATSCAYGINASGLVVGESETASGDWHAFLKKPDATMQDLNNLVQLPTGFVLLGASAINDNGWIVGYAFDTSAQLNRAFLLTPNTNDVKPVANAGTSQSVALGDLVTLNGTGSSDPNGHQLDYKWSFGPVPPGSAWANNFLSTATPSFLPDLCGTYVIQLVVNNGSSDSDPSMVTIQVTLTGHSVILSIQKLQAQISDLDSKSFKNANMQNALLNKLNAVIGNIDAGNYVDALNQLRQDILGKATGKNSWITDPLAQSQIYDSLTAIIAELMALQ